MDLLGLCEIFFFFFFFIDVDTFTFRPIIFILSINIITRN